MPVGRYAAGRLMLDYLDGRASARDARLSSYRNSERVCGRALRAELKVAISKDALNLQAIGMQI
jgi:hypothetical protein